MFENYIAFDLTWRLLAMPLIIILFCYIFIHFLNYNIQKSKAKAYTKYIIRELSSAMHTVFYALVITSFLLYISFIGTYVSAVAKDMNITNGSDGLKFIIQLGLKNTE